MEREWFILVAVLAGVALVLVLWLWWTSTPSEVEEANQVGEAGEHLVALEASRSRVGFRNTTEEARDRAIEIITRAINRLHQRQQRPVGPRVQRDIHVRAPAGSHVVVNPPGGQPPANS